MGDRTPRSNMSFIKIVRSRRHTLSAALVRPSVEPRPKRDRPILHLKPAAGA